jgi:hypothetical protein
MVVAQEELSGASELCRPSWMALRSCMRVGVSSMRTVAMWLRKTTSRKAK